ncbi:MAG: ribonuclease E/G, partial [Symploca sp. SIO1C4]|nr:ribonuclease E/G [Symploca sp. SIO1C4]
LDFAPFNYTDELELVNHPSYQEQGVANGSTRRRRRRRIDEPVVKDELALKSNSRPTLVSQRSSDLSIEDDVSDTGDLEGKPLVKSREAEPLEKIVVEMTSEEQDVYALMGISPLKKLNREIRHPKSAIVSVVLPGEAEQMETSSEISLKPSVVEMPEVESLQELDETETPQQLILTSPVELSTTEEITTDSPSSPSESESSSESDSSHPLVRRRRRRSSAIDS